MLSLKGKQDKYRILLPDNFIPKEIEEKYAKVLQRAHSFIYKPIDFLNETIQKIQVLGITGGTMQQNQPTKPSLDYEDNYDIKHVGEREFDRDRFNHTSNEVTYRSPNTPLMTVDKTLNITFRHTSGFLNYFLLFETFFYQYSRHYNIDDLPGSFVVDIYNEYNEIYSRINLFDPLIDGMDMLDLDFSQPVASSQTFNVSFKYSNIDFEFIDINKDEDSEQVYSVIDDNTDLEEQQIIV